MSKLPFFLASLLYLATLSLHAQYLPNAHAHNDYEHERPLYEALEHGFASIEVDIFLIEGELYVAHDRPNKLDPQRTLRTLYLDPLRKRITENLGQVYAGVQDPLLLMIDFKTEAVSTYQTLKQQLSDYQDLLVTRYGDSLTPAPLQIFISGNRPTDLVRAERESWVGIDGRPDDLGKGYTSAFMPVISQNYYRVIRWRGERGYFYKRTLIH